MSDLATHIREYFEATTEPVDIDRLIAVRADSDPITAARREAMTIDLEQAPTTSGIEPHRDRRRSAATWIVSAAALVIAVIALVVAARPADDEPLQPAATSTVPDTEGALSPAEVLDLYENAVNARDLDAIMLLYADDAVVIGHPTGPDVATGHDEIRSAENASLIQMADRDGQVFWLTQREFDGDVASAGHVWYSFNACFAGAGDRIVIEDGLIVEWDRGSNSQRCVRDVLDDLLAAAENRSASRLASSLDLDVALTGHPDTATDPVVGRSAVGELLAGEFDSFADDAVPELVNIEWNGPVASFDLVLRAQSTCSSIVGNTVVAEGGQIVEWTWGTESTECSPEE